MEPGDIILLAEDDRIDQKSVQRAFKDLQITNPLIVVQNGEEALEFLHDSDKPIPCLILLDLRMPVMDGLECLEKIKQDDALRVIPVVILTTSEEDHDTLRSFELGAAGYMVKPVNYEKFIRVIRTISLYWTLSLTPALVGK